MSRTLWRALSGAHIRRREALSIGLWGLFSLARCRVRRRFKLGASDRISVKEELPRLAFGRVVPEERNRRAKLKRVNAARAVAVKDVEGAREVRVPVIHSHRRASGASSGTDGSGARVGGRGGVARRCGRLGGVEGSEGSSSVCVREELTFA